jgi:hypothetical protein
MTISVSESSGPDNSTAALERHRQALLNAEACGQCGRALATGEVCYRVRATWGCIPGRVPEEVRRLALLCRACVSAHWQAQPWTPCEACGRPVVEAWSAQRFHTFCSYRASAGCPGVADAGHLFDAQKAEAAKTDAINRAGAHAPVDWKQLSECRKG